MQVVLKYEDQFVNRSLIASVLGASGGLATTAYNPPPLLNLATRRH